MPTKIPVFLSVGNPHTTGQREYLTRLQSHLSDHGILAETLGATFWSIKSPLQPVQQKMGQVYGAVVLAMERFHATSGAYKEGSPDEKRVGDQYFTTVWSHIEAAMAYQMRLPLLILKEEKLRSEGMVDSGIHEWLIIRINVSDPDEIQHDPIRSFIDAWIEEVKKVYYGRANPP